MPTNKKKLADTTPTKKLKSGSGRGIPKKSAVLEESDEDDDKDAVSAAKSAGRGGGGGGRGAPGRSTGGRGRGGGRGGFMNFLTVLHILSFSRELLHFFLVFPLLLVRIKIFASYPPP